MKVLNIYDPQNTWWGTLRRFQRDGDEFERQANIAKEFYADKMNAVVEMYEIKGKTAQEKRQRLLIDLSWIMMHKFDRINFFCHGHPKALNRNMFRMLPTKLNNLPLLAERLKAIAADDCKIVLYSCKTAKLGNGFAFELSLLTRCDVISHTTRGHTTRNPFKKLIYWGHESPFVFTRPKELWHDFGGIRALKKQLRRSKFAPFEFVEKVFGGE